MKKQKVGILSSEPIARAGVQNISTTKETIEVERERDSRVMRTLGVFRWRRSKVAAVIEG